MTENLNQNPAGGFGSAPAGGADLGQPGEMSPAEIEAEIERTRQRMTENIEAISEKLSPDHIKQQAREALHDAQERVVESVRDVATGAGEQARRAGEGIVELVRRHPVPAAVVGVGVAWLLVRNARHRSAGPERIGGYEGFNQNMEYDPGYVPSGVEPELAGEQQGRLGETMGRVTERAGEMAAATRERAGEMAATTRERAGELASATRERAGRLASQAREQASHLGHVTREGAQRASQSFQEVLEENPLVVGAAALLLGTAVGLLMPPTRREDRLMGEARDRLVDRAQETAREVKEVAAETARHVRDTARQELESNRETLKSGARDMVESVKSAATRVANEAKETAKREAANRQLPLGQSGGGPSGGMAQDPSPGQPS